MARCNKLAAAVLLAACLLLLPAPSAAAGACDAASAACQRQCAPLTPKFDCKEADGAVSSSCACTSGGGTSPATPTQGAEQAQSADLSGGAQSDAPASGSAKATPVQQVMATGAGHAEQRLQSVPATARLSPSRAA